MVGQLLHDVQRHSGAGHVGYTGVLQGCELLSNLVSLTDCKQRLSALYVRRMGCELLSNLVSLTDCKQLYGPSERPDRTCDDDCGPHYRGACYGYPLILLRISGIVSIFVPSLKSDFNGRIGCHRLVNGYLRSTCSILFQWCCEGLHSDYAEK